MKNQKLKLLLVIAAILLVIYPPAQVQAKVYPFYDMDMEITVPEDTIILTQDTPDTDELWSKAGITDPKAIKENMNNVGSQAVLYDPKTDTTINLLLKQSSESKKVFNLSLLSEAELKEFLDNLITIDDENTVITVEKYPQQEIPFFRVSIDATKDNASMKEIIYGTVVNGKTISYDLYSQNKTEPFDESFIKELVAGTHFTHFLDKEEERLHERSILILFIVQVAVFITLIIIWIFLRKNRRKKQEALKKRKLEALEQFYKNKKLKEEQHIEETKFYLNKTRYTEEIIKKFFFYNEIYRRKVRWIISAVIYAFVLYSLIENFIYLLIAIVVLVGLIYFQNSQMEKLVKNTVKSFGSNMNKEVTAIFYEDYVSISGIQYNTTIPYVQITEVREYKDFIYLYLGYNKAYYLQKDSFEQGAQEFRKFINQRVYLK